MAVPKTFHSANGSSNASIVFLVMALITATCIGIVVGLSIGIENLTSGLDERLMTVEYSMKELVEDAGTYDRQLQGMTEQVANQRWELDDFKLELREIAFTWGN